MVVLFNTQNADSRYLQFWSWHLIKFKIRFPLMINTCISKLFLLEWKLHDNDVFKCMLHYIKVNFARNIYISVRYIFLSKFIFQEYETKNQVLAWFYLWNKKPNIYSDHCIDAFIFFFWGGGVINILKNAFSWHVYAL